jgi:hypothetical protein
MSWSYGPPKDRQQMIARLRAAVERASSGLGASRPTAVVSSNSIIGQGKSAAAGNDNIFCAASSA